MPKNQAVRNADMRRLGIIGTIAICATLVVIMVAVLTGMKIQMAKVLDLCEKGGTFYALDESGDTPYRCTRVIDYPPSITEGFTQ